MSGHDHCISHTKKDGNTYILSGAASQTWNVPSNAATLASLGVEVQYAIHRGNKGGVRGAFSSVEMTDTTMTVRHHDDKGGLLFENADLKPRSAASLGQLRQRA